MLRPPIRYARTDDGVTIAYCSVGDGPSTVVLVPGLISQVEVAWEEPAFEHFMSRLAAVSQVVMFDRRGTGLSDQAMASGEGLALPRLARDVEAVLHAVGSQAAVVVGFSLGGMTAIQFAADHPDRTDALIVMGTTAALARGDGFPIGMDSTGLDDYVDAVAGEWGTDGAQLAEANAPSMQADVRFRSWAARLQRHTCSPGMVAASLRRAATYDLRPRLADVGVPTLVLHRRDDRVVGVEHGRYLAEHIPRAAYVELAGADHMFFAGDQEAVLEAILAFVDDHVTHGALRTMARRAERRNAYGYGWDSLTPSEREVARLAATGLTKKEVAERLHMSPHTVDGRLRRVFAKLAVTSRAELAAEISRVAS